MVEAIWMGISMFLELRVVRRSEKIRRRNCRRAKHIVGVAARVRQKALKRLEQAERLERFAKKLDDRVKLPTAGSNAAVHPPETRHATVQGNGETRRTSQPPAKLLKSNLSAAAIWQGNTFSFRYLQKSRDGKRDFLASFTFDKVADLTSVLGQVASYGSRIESLDVTLRQDLAYYSAALAKVPVMIASKKKKSGQRANTAARGDSRRPLPPAHIVADVVNGSGK
jgi:hypothetical protein